jgi:hypothetical protein
MVNGSILSTVNDSLYTPRNFPSQLLPLLARHFKNPTASSDTDTTLSLALKQFDAQNDKTIYLRYPMGVFSG